LQIIYPTCNYGKSFESFLTLVKTLTNSFKKKRNLAYYEHFYMIVQNNIPIAKRCGVILEFKSFMPQMQLVLTLLTNDG
jgi:hypothetical protein